MNQFELRIIACEGVFYDGACESLIVPVEDGTMGILAGHERMSVAIEAGRLKFVNSTGETVECEVGIGILNVGPERTTVLVDYAVKPDEVERIRAQEEKIREEEEIRQSRSRQEYLLAESAVARAMDQMKNASGGRRTRGSLNDR